MRRVTRSALPAPTAAALDQLQAHVNAAADPRAEAEARWQRKPAGPFAAVRTALDQMANGRARCMYCEDSAGTDIEHFRPKSVYPARAFVWENYLLACSFCNSNRKRSRFPLDATGAPLLIDPSDAQDDPIRHLELLPTSGRYRGRSPKGATSVEVFDLNAEARPGRLPEGRRATLIKLQPLILDSDRCISGGDEWGGHELRRVILDEPFPAVRGYLLQIAAGPNAALLLRAGVSEAIDRHGMAAW